MMMMMMINKKKIDELVNYLSTVCVCIDCVKRRVKTTSMEYDDDEDNKYEDYNDYRDDLD